MCSLAAAQRVQRRGCGKSALPSLPTAPRITHLSRQGNAEGRILEGDALGALAGGLLSCHARQLLQHELGVKQEGVAGGTKAASGLQGRHSGVHQASDGKEGRKELSNRKASRAMGLLVQPPVHADQAHLGSRHLGDNLVHGGGHVAADLGAQRGVHDAGDLELLLQVGVGLAVLLGRAGKLVQRQVRLDLDLSGATAREEIEKPLGVPIAWVPWSTEYVVPGAPR
jgi:hypothetical protein